MYNKKSFLYLLFFILLFFVSSCLYTAEAKQIGNECAEILGSDLVDWGYQWEDGTSTGWLDCATLKPVGLYHYILQDKNGVYFSPKTSGVQPMYRISPLSGEEVSVIDMPIKAKKKQRIALDRNVTILNIGNHSYLGQYPYFEINKNYRIVFITKNKKKTIYMSDGSGYVIWRDSSFLYPDQDAFIQGSFQTK